MSRCANVLSCLTLSVLGCSGPVRPPDAFVTDADQDARLELPTAPERLFVAPTAGMCPELNVPTYPGRTRGVAAGNIRWEHPTMVESPESQTPTFVTNASVWTRDLWALDIIDHDFGDEEARAYTAPLAPAPTMMENGSLWRYRHAPMTLGSSIVVSRDAFGLWYADLSTTFPARHWRFPELEEMVNVGEPLPRTNPNIEQVMPAWSPMTGQIAYPVGYDNALLAVSCPVDFGGQYILRFGSIPEGAHWSTHVYYRSNGELIVHRGGVFVVSPTGEILRSTAGPGDAEPYAYAEGCGLLYRDETNYFWLDVDSLETGSRFDMRDFSGASGLSDCSLFGGNSRGGTVVTVDGARSQVSGPGDQVVELDGGGFVVIDTTTREFQVYDPARALLGAGRLEGDVRLGGGGPIFTPDGHVMWVSRSGGGFWDLDLPPLGPMLWPEAGMNWAHTNSPLPQPR